MRLPLAIGIASILLSSLQVEAAPSKLVLSASERASTVVLGDGAGHMLVLLKPGSEKSWLYYGDGKQFHKQRVESSGGSPGEGNYSWGFVAPGYRPNERALTVRDSWSKWSLTCGDRQSAFHEVTGAARERVLKEAEFREAKWERKVYFLARDDRGTYYFVDNLRDSRFGMRLFIGRVGQMKNVVLSDLVSDSEGDLFFTSKGKLRVDGGLYAKKRRATWIHRKKRTNLLVLGAWENVKLIYEKLGVYKGVRFGTPCDDL